MYQVIDIHDREWYATDDWTEARDMAREWSVDYTTLMIRSDGRVVALAVDGKVID